MLHSIQVCSLPFLNALTCFCVSQMDSFHSSISSSTTQHIPQLAHLPQNPPPVVVAVVKMPDRACPEDPIQVTTARDVSELKDAIREIMFLRLQYCPAFCLHVWQCPDMPRETSLVERTHPFTLLVDGCYYWVKAPGCL